MEQTNEQQLNNQPRGLFEGGVFDDYCAPLFIPWQLNAECNLRCLHCCEQAGAGMADQMTKDEALDFCRQVVELKVPYMAISGGEPMLCPYFFDVCEFIRANHISLKVETNGEFIDEQSARRLAELKLRSVQVSLDGATARTHSKLRPGGNWEKAIEACKLLVKHGVTTEIVFVPVKFNIHETAEVVDLAYSLGVYGFYTGKTMRIGRAAQNWDSLCPGDEEYERFYEVLREKQALYEGKMKVYCYPHDVIDELKYRLESPSADLLTLPNGKVKLINSLPFICGDLKKQSLIQVWEGYKKAWREPKVIEFVNRLIEDPRLLAETNNWIEV
jgi:MoaA/NifB/PqqE/SkfB family radical SAM enzyme